MLMLDRGSATADTWDRMALPCHYCGVGHGIALVGGVDRQEPGWLAHLYLCQGLSTYAIGEITGLDRELANEVAAEGRGGAQRLAAPAAAGRSLARTGLALSGSWPACMRRDASVHHRPLPSLACRSARSCTGCAATVSPSAPAEAGTAKPARPWLPRSWMTWTPGWA